MTAPSHDPLDEDDVALLLPWYAAGTLEEDERRRVERFLEENPEQIAHLRAVEEELDGTQALNRALPAPGPGSIDAILAQVRREEGRAAARTTSPGTASSRGVGGLFAAIGGWLDALSPPVRGLAVAALVLVAVAQAGVIGALVGTEPTPQAEFRTATGDATAPAPAEANLLVMFAPDATAAAIGALLEEIGARIVDGPRAGGVYALALADEATAEAALARLEAAGDVVVFAGPGE
ncbi:hypothetical protein [Salinarimonas sp.]|uniref:S8 family serine peptidase n=1 Tax=Salinarimonas sp. TaxID=2766526 RepID=UPI0032D999CF